MEQVAIILVKVIIFIIIIGISSSDTEIKLKDQNNPNGGVIVHYKNGLSILNPQECKIEISCGKAINLKLRLWTKKSRIIF